ncbi:MAG: DinB family protein [Actinomycetota bacterium]|nr:DinB family protein [Actinomycetota bacterium]
MPTVTDALVEGFSRTPDLVGRALDGLSEADLIRRVDPDANTVAWLIWHTARMQDGQVTRARRALGSAGADQVWTAAGYAERFGLDVGDDQVGYGMTPDQVAQVKAPANLLQGYHQAVNDATVEWLRGLDDSDYDRVVDESWDPPVTLLSRLVSIEQDAAQHLGQAAFVRGVLQRT